MKYLLALFFLITATASAQDILYTRKVLDTLTSPAFWGRGYTNNGMQKTAQYLQQQYRQMGLLPLAGSNYLQPFTFSVNTFAGAMKLNVNGKALRPGIDFIVSAESRGYKGKVSFEKKDSLQFIDNKNKVVLLLKDKLTWSVSTDVADYTAVEVDMKALDNEPVSADIGIENKWVPSFTAANVCGMIKGTQKPDSLLVISAHYDHLGGLGSNTYFPGANDNASGVSFLLSMAKYYTEHPPAYSIAFICFAAEEAGLLGSKFFTENPLLPLNRIRFLLNLDLVGTGSEGITVVNATGFATEFNWLKQIDHQHNLLSQVNARGKAANSDHYWFTEKGVPAFFIYTMGGIKAYHDVFDKSATLPMDEYDDLFKLIIEFNKKLMNTSETQ